MMRNEKAYEAGYQAAIEGNFQNCPHPFWSPLFYLWHAGNLAGQEYAFAMNWLILTNYPQD